MIRVRVISMEKLFNELNLTHVDYLKMDIEGKETRILGADVANLEWLSQVRQINGEVHGDALGNARLEMAGVLLAHGFHVRESRLHWSSLLAVRDREHGGA